MKSKLLKFLLLCLATALTVGGAVLGVSAYTADTGHPDAVTSAVGADRDLYLLPGTRDAAATYGWQTANIKNKNSYSGTDFPGGEALWFDFDYYYDSNVIDEVQFRLRNGSQTALFKIDASGTLLSCVGSPAISKKVPGEGWHHITAKYFQQHILVGDTYEFSYGLTLWMNGEFLGTTAFSESECKLFTSERKLNLYYAENGTLKPNSSLYAYIYSGTSNGAASSTNTSNYVLLRDIYVTCRSDAEHAADFTVYPVTYVNAPAFKPNSSVSTSSGEQINVPSGYTPATDEDGKPLTFPIVNVDWFIRAGETVALAIPDAVSEGMLFSGWYTDAGYTQPLVMPGVEISGSESHTFYARFTKTALASWLLLPGAEYTVAGNDSTGYTATLSGGWQSNDLGSTANAKIDFMSNDNAMWWDFDYYCDSDTTKTVELRFLGSSNGSDRLKTTVFSIQNNILKPSEGFYGKHDGIALTGEGYHHISIGFRQISRPNPLGDAIEHIITATVYVDGVEKNTYTVTNINAWLNSYRFGFFSAKLDESGNFDVIYPWDSDAAANGVYPVKAYYYGGDFYVENKAVDTDRHVIHLRNTVISFGPQSPYRNIKPITFHVGEGGSLPLRTVNGWDATEWKTAYYLPLPADGRLPADIVNIHVSKTAGQAYGRADYAAKDYTLVNADLYYFADANEPLPIPTLGASIFEGWYTNAAFTGSPVTTYGELNGATALYAKFKATYTATVIIGGETAFSEKVGYLDLPDTVPSYLSADGKIYAAGDRIVLESDLTLYGIGISMLPGASVRFSSPTGMRFEALLPKADQEVLASLGLSYELGVLIVPTDKLKGASAFTAEALDAKNISYLDISSADRGAILTENGDRIFRAAIVEILGKNYTRPFSAISYVQLASGERLYSFYDEAENSRSVFDVAAAAFADSGAGYTEAQVKVLRAFLDSVFVLDDRSGTMKRVDAVAGYTSPYSFTLSQDNILTVTAEAGASVEALTTLLISGEAYTRGWTVTDGKLVGKYLHGAYMEYTMAKNFYDEYTDPFGMKAEDYKTVTVSRTDSSTYAISYAYGDGSSYRVTFVKKWWGVWMLGAMTYTDKTGTAHKIVGATTDFEFVMVAGTNFSTFRGGNHGGYANVTNKELDENDPTTAQNDVLLAMALYDGKSGEEISLAVGESIDASGLRVVMYNNIYEKSYTRENVFFNVMKSYLFNGDDIHFDARLYATRQVPCSYLYVGMLPIAKTYGNCMKVTTDTGDLIYAKTGLVGDSNFKPSVDVEPSYRIELWGENNPALHSSIEIRKDAANPWGKENIRLWDMNASSNKVYFRADPTNTVKGTEWHLGSTWSFDYLPEFSYTGSYDHLLGSATE